MQGPPTYVSIDFADVDADGALRCTSDAYPAVLTLKKWAIKTGSISIDDIYSDDLKLLDFTRKSDSKITVECTVIYFSELTTINMSEIIAFSIKSKLMK